MNTLKKVVVNVTPAQGTHKRNLLHLNATSSSIPVETDSKQQGGCGGEATQTPIAGASFRSFTYVPRIPFCSEPVGAKKA